MKTHSKSKATLVVGALIVAFAAPAFGGQPSDAWITTQAKISLLSDEVVNGLAVDIDTFDGRVTIHGKLETEEAKRRAEARVREIDGVDDVRNLIAVVPQAAEEKTRVSDEELTRDIETVLDLDRALDGSDISVRSVNDGNVVIDGHARTLSAHRRALENVRSVEGVRRVASEIESPDEIGDEEIWAEDAEVDRLEEAGAPIADAWITTKAKLVLMHELSLSPFQVNVDTSHRVVTLFGIVPTEDAKKLAGATVSSMSGVKGVENELQVVPDVAAERVQDRDVELLARVKERIDGHSGLADLGIGVEVKNAVARLTGTVPSEATRVTAVTVARATQGIESVVDGLSVHGAVARPTNESGSQ